jgi:tRNA(Ile)-lysidine synthase
MTPIIEQFISSNKIFRKEDKIIVAVSGGVDSMVLLTLLHQLKYQIAVAHCNYRLRAEASDLDEELVKNYCKQLGIVCYVKIFDCKTAELNTGNGIQELARNLRYEWFDQLLETNNYDKIATAHHQDDQLETLLFNLIRGTGLDGMRGIAVKKEQLVRPLLCYSKSEILNIADTYQIPFRTDHTNLEVKYTRNKIRHQVVPLLKVINKNAASHAQQLSEWASFYVAELSEIEAFENLDIELIKKHPYPAQFLMLKLKNYGFNKHQIENLLSCIENKAFGSVFISAKYQLFVNKNQLEITENQEPNSLDIHINKLPFSTYINGMKLSIEIIEKPSTLKQTDTFYIGLQSLQFPLIISTIKAGDTIQPFGMNGHKTIGNFFTDKKVAHKHRKSAFKLTIQDEIAALIPFTIDQKFSVTTRTSIVLKISIK